jgi:hypothetical protein
MCTVSLLPVLLNYIIININLQYPIHLFIFTLKNGIKTPEAVAASGVL